MKNGRVVDTGNRRGPNNGRKEKQRGRAVIYLLILTFNARVIVGCT